MLAIEEERGGRANDSSSGIWDKVQNKKGL